MDIKQIYDLTNESVKEVLGAEAIVNEDLSNLVSIGEELFNASAYDKYVKALINHIGKRTTLFLSQIRYCILTMCIPPKNCHNSTFCFDTVHLRFPLIS